jgi:hypothetical protein
MRVELREARNGADRQRGAKNLEVATVDLVPQSRLSDLVQPLEPIRRVRVSVWHYESMERDRKPGVAPRLHRRGRPNDTSAG